ncbi:TonB-dependent receptor [Novosphingobium lentum]|uniref:TonB-dependent receptor n=1 Tax=Novosphingobium lentum TaxID=145287 RepID=UPI0008345FD2|nr:TonB-dependent receptor [Novosphingobium lentum]
MKIVFAGRRASAVDSLARPALLAGAAGLALAIAAQAHAQAPAAQPAEEMAQPAADAPSAATGEGNEIIVTATKREQTLQDIPVAVSVTTAQTLERAQIRDIQDLQSVVPSLRVNQLQSSANTNFFIRGFGNGANNAGIEPSVGVFIDGVYRSRSAGQVGDFPDVQRIEVLRGPQSTLFGKNASVGVISIVTKAPQFTLGGNVEASYGNYNAVVLKGVITGPITKDLAVSLAGGYNRRDGYNEDLGTGNKTNERNRWFVRGQALYEPTSQLKIRLIGDYAKVNENCCGVVNLQPSAATAIIRALGGNVNATSDRFGNHVYDNFDSTNKIENYGLSGQVDYEAGPLTFTSITAYRRTNAVTNQDSDFSSADLIGRNFQDLRIKTFTQELRLATNLEGPLNFLLGGYYFNENIKQANQITLGTQFRPYGNALVQGATGGALSLPVLEGTFGALEGNPGKYIGQFFATGQGLDEHYRLKDEAFSVFAQADFKIGDRLTLTGGVNYTKDKKNFGINVNTTDAFSQINLDNPAYAPFRKALLLGGALQSAGIDPNNAAAVGAFATNPATAPIFAAFNAFATANQNNPAANPLNALKGFQFLPPGVPVPNAVEPGKTSDDKFTYLARAAYKITDQVNVYASFATGFKASSINLSRDSRPFPSDAAALSAAGLTQVNQTFTTRFAQPENSTVYELGLKANWGVVSVNIAAFDQIIRNFQSNVFTGLGFVLTNAGKQSVKGFEFEGTARPTPELTLSMALTYLKPKYDQFNLSALGNLSGTRPAGIPAISATWGAQYDHGFANDDHLIAHLDYHYESPVLTEEGLPNFLDAKLPDGGTANAIAASRQFMAEVSELNASLTYAMHNGMELSVWGRNLTDHRYLLNIFPSVAQLTSVSGYTSPPRTYGVSGRYRF